MISFSKSVSDSFTLCFGFLGIVDIFDSFIIHNLEKNWHYEVKLFNLCIVSGFRNKGTPTFLFLTFTFLTCLWNPGTYRRKIMLLSSAQFGLVMGQLLAFHDLQFLKNQAGLLNLKNLENQTKQKQVFTRKFFSNCCNKHPKEPNSIRTDKSSHQKDTQMFNLQKTESSKVNFCLCPCQSFQRS